MQGITTFTKTNIFDGMSLQTKKASYCFTAGSFACVWHNYKGNGVQFLFWFHNLLSIGFDVKQWEPVPIETDS